MGGVLWRPEWSGLKKLLAARAMAGAGGVYDVFDQAPYLFRASGGGLAIGNREIDKLVGGTMAWNQLANFTLLPSNANGIRYTSSDGKSVTFNGTATATENRTGWFGIQENTMSERIGHYILFIPKILSGSFEGGSIQYSLFSGQAFDFNSPIITAVPNIQSRQRIATQISSGSIANNYTVTFTCFDLTQMFGSTIADYVYGLEQATAGAGVAWFRRLFPKDYYAYNAGELMSVNAAAHIMRDAAENIIGDYPLDHSLTLRGIPKLDESNALYYDGDTYASDGTVTRRYGIVDLGTLEWTYQPAYTRFYCNPANMKPITSQNIVPVNYMMSKYTPLRSYDFGNLGTDKAYCIFEDGRLLIRDTSYSDAATFKTAMSGVYFVYELATPTTEVAEPFQNPQIVDASGTEEYVDYAESQGARDVAIPVGHETYYLSPG